MAEELLEKIPPKKRWELTASILTRFIVLRLLKARPLLGKGEGIIAPVLAYEKYMEINAKIWGESGRKSYPWVKESFNIPVKDAVGAAELVTVAATLTQGPEWEYKIVEAVPERVVYRITKCAFMERLKELVVDPEHIPDFSSCAAACQAWSEEGVTAISPKLTFTLTKAMPRGDPFCENVYEFKEE